MTALLALIEGMEAQRAEPAAILQAVKAFVATEAFASDQIEDQRAQNRARQARWRNAQKEKRSANVSITSHNVTEAAPPSPPLVPSLTLPSLNPSTSTPPLKPSSRERAMRLPEDWVLPDDWRAWAENETQDGRKLDRARIGTEAAKFADFWHAKAGKDAAKVNWLATWRNWIRKALENMPLSRTPAAPLPAAPAGEEAVFENGRLVYKDRKTGVVRAAAEARAVA
jgi:hypothetical protein